MHNEIEQVHRPWIPATRPVGGESSKVPSDGRRDPVGDRSRNFMFLGDASPLVRRLNVVHPFFPRLAEIKRLEGIAQDCGDIDNVMSLVFRLIGFRRESWIHPDLLVGPHATLDGVQQNSSWQGLPFGMPAT